MISNNNELNFLPILHPCQHVIGMEWTLHDFLFVPVVPLVAARVRVCMYRLCARGVRVPNFINATHIGGGIERGRGRCSLSGHLFVCFCLVWLCLFSLKGFLQRFSSNFFCFFFCEFVLMSHKFQFFTVNKLCLYLYSDLVYVLRHLKVSKMSTTPLPPLLGSHVEPSENIPTQ